MSCGATRCSRAIVKGGVWGAFRALTGVCLRLGFPRRRGCPVVPWRRWPSRAPLIVSRVFSFAYALRRRSCGLAISSRQRPSPSSFGQAPHPGERRSLAPHLAGPAGGSACSFSDAALGWRGGVDPELRVSCRSCPCVRRQRLAAAWPGRPERVDTWLRPCPGWAADRSSVAPKPGKTPRKPCLFSCPWGSPSHGLSRRSCGAGPRRAPSGHGPGATFELDSGPFYLHFPGCLQRVGNMMRARVPPRFNGLRLG